MKFRESVIFGLYKVPAIGDYYLKGTKNTKSSRMVRKLELLHEGTIGRYKTRFLGN